MAEPISRKKSFITKQEFALIGAAFLWGGTFLIIHSAMLYCGPLFFVGFRFILAGFFSSMVFWRSLKGITRQELIAGMVVSIAIFLGYSLQTAGLKTLSSTQSAFISAIYVPLVPLLQWVILQKLPRLTSWIGVGFAFIGLMLVSGQGISGIAFSFGELLTLGSAFAIALEIVLISLFAGRVDSRRVTVVQLFFAGILSFCFMPLNGETIPEFSWVWFGAGFGLAAMTALIQLTMNWAQKSVSPTRATIIYTGEPVWAGVFGRIAGERLPSTTFLGALLIIIGILIVELKPEKWRKAR